MTHPEFWPLIDAYADGMLPAPEVERLQNHLGECSDCRLRLEGAMREAASLRMALSAPEPPSGLLASIMARIRAEDISQRPVRSGVYAGVMSNLVTATILFLLSLGSNASLVLVAVVAFLGAILWGSVKGVVFATLSRFMPGGVIGRGLLFGVGVWAVTNTLLAASGGFGADSEYATTVVLLGSLAHHLLYGVLVSLLYARFAAPSWAGDTARGAP